MSWGLKFEEDARLVILAELARQRDASLNVLSITRVVDAMGVRRPPEWVATQLDMLEVLGAVNLRESDLPGLGKVKIATLTVTGRNHVDRRIQIAGVTPPADEE